MPYQPEAFEIQGVTFRLLPSSPHNMRKAQNFLQEEMQDAGIESVDEDSQWDVLSQVNLSILKACAEPVGDEGFDDIDPMQLDGNEVKYYFQQFMGKSSGTPNALKGF